MRAKARRWSARSPETVNGAYDPAQNNASRCCRSSERTPPHQLLQPPVIEMARKIRPRSFAASRLVERVPDARQRPEITPLQGKREPRLSGFGSAALHGPLRHTRRLRRRTLRNSYANVIDVAIPSSTSIIFLLTDAALRRNFSVAWGER